jgi:hypothetical protein
VADALVRAMSKRPEDRFESVVEFVQAMGGDLTAPATSVSLAALPVPVPELTSAPTQQLERRRRKPLMALGLVAAAALLLALGLTLPNRPAATPPSAGSGPPETPATAVNPGYLWVSSSPWGYLFVDGQAKGATPQMGLEVPPGRHRLTISRDGYRTYEQDIEIGPGQELRVTGVQLRRSEQ